MCIRLSSFLALLLVAAAPAQQPEAIVAGRDAPLAVCRDGDDVFGVGPDYLLHATHDHVTFTPVLGAAAPRSVPLTMRLIGVARGGDVLSLAAPQRSERGAHVVYERGAMRERYELRADGIEQTFVFDARPAGNGDLVVRLGVECAVAGVVREGGGLRFLDECGGGVVYGALLGVDARGATAPGTLQLVDDELQLRLPAAFVDAATYPLTFDPLLGTASLANSTTDDADPAVAWVPSPARWLVVWRRVVAAGESHLIGQFVEPGISGGAPFVVSATAGLDVSLPRVAACASASSFVVAWRSATGVFAQNPGIKFRPVPASGAAPGSLFTFTSASSLLALADAPPNMQVLPMVWGDNSGQLRSVGLQFSGPDNLIPFGGGTLDVAPQADAQVAITRHTGPIARYVVAWTRGTVAQNGIVGGVIDQAGTVIGPAKALTGSNQARRVSLDGDGTDFLLAWDDPFGEHVQPGHIVLTLAVFEANLLGAAQDLQLGGTQITGDVAKVGNRYVVSYRRDNGLFDTECRVQMTDSVGTMIGSFAQLVGPPRAGDYDRQGVARLAPIDALNGADDRMLTVFEEGQTVLPLDRDVVLQQFETMGAGGPVTTLAPSCGVGGITQTLGPCAVGNSAFQLRLSNGDPTAPFALLSLAVQPVLVPCGPCLLLAPDVLETPPVIGGFAGRPFPIPLNGNLIGASFAAQWLTAFGATGSCNLFPFLTPCTVIRVEVGL